MTVLMLLSILIVVLNVEVDGAVFFVMIISAVLILSSRLTDAMLPAMLLAVFVTRCYDSADVFLARAWAAAPAVIAVVYHFIKYRKPIKLGRSFYGTVAVSAAVTLGGLGTIAVSDYFAPTALFYVFGLGFGMTAFYLLIKSQLTDDAPHEIVKIMYAVGLLAVFCVLRFYIDRWEVFRTYQVFLFFHSSNNLATFLMLAMPFPLIYANKRHGDIFVVCLMYIATVFTGSRGGIFMGSVEFGILLLYWAFGGDKSKLKTTVSVVVIVACAVALVFWVPYVAELCGVDFSSDDGEPLTFYEYTEKIVKRFFDKTRATLLNRMIEDFKTNPLFGVGVGYTGNSDVYNPVKGAMNWYHMWFAQVIGGLGLVGIAAYGYQLVDRIRIYLSCINRQNTVFLFSYMGLFLMSQVNPGEFCPMPYAALMVTYFAMMESGAPASPFARLKAKADANCAADEEKLPEKTAV